MSFLIYKRKDNPVFCDVLVRPLATEKTVQFQEHNVYTFLVTCWADKRLIQRAVESLFDVRVDHVNVANQKGKMKSFRGRLGLRRDVRKAYVRLATGHRIELTSGL